MTDHPERRPYLFSMLEKLGVDVLALQEVTPDFHQELLQQEWYYCLLQGEVFVLRVRYYFIKFESLWQLCSVSSSCPEGPSMAFSMHKKICTFVGNMCTGKEICSL
eukprot:TRINITY_DN4842_c0_g1_i14.p2 TRINITY_DN4842_c0_g1~~TRINITY_DN4842_c0_g1_i14.p2  ORF type:complete len:106 (-),score=16.92 TRINITY_DN4842_c0_g1_i14:285-602(-)